jgi:5-formyltetrahydrofolate cyclo-ligase
VGVDRQGNRIGQGAGHYDRALQSLRADGSPRTIGLAWDVQLVESVPADPWDQPLDYVITPSRTIEIRP